MKYWVSRFPGKLRQAEREHRVGKGSVGWHGGSAGSARDTALPPLLGAAAFPDGVTPGVNSQGSTSTGTKGGNQYLQLSPLLPLPARNEKCQDL